MCVAGNSDNATNHTITNGGLIACRFPNSEHQMPLVYELQLLFFQWLLIVGFHVEFGNSVCDVASDLIASSRTAERRAVGCQLTSIETRTEILD
jgi:hypothetical protein